MALNVPFLRQIHIELMAASTSLQFVRIFRGDADKKQQRLEQTLLQHPHARFDLRTVTEDDGSFETWLGDRPV